MRRIFAYLAPLVKELSKHDNIPLVRSPKDTALSSGESIAILGQRAWSVTRVTCEIRVGLRAEGQL